MEAITITDVRKKTYEDGLLSYGIMTLCYLMREFEKQENYEECQIIYEVISESNRDLNLNLPTKYEDCVPYLEKEVDKRHFTHLVKNVPEYARELRRKL